MVPTVKSTVLFTLKYVKRIDFMLSALTTTPPPHKNVKKFLEVMDMCSTLIVLMVSWVYAYIQTHKCVCIMCGFIYRLTKFLKKYLCMHF